MRSCDTQETFKGVESLRMDSKLAELATRSSGRSSVNTMTILLIAFDSTTIHDTTFVYQHVFSAGLYFRVRRITLKRVDFGEECAENRTPNRSAAIGV